MSFLLAVTMAALLNGTHQTNTALDTWVRIDQGACTSKAVLGRIAPSDRAYFRHARAEINGKRHEACWVPKDGRVQIIYDDGDIGRLPAAAFWRVLES